MRARIAQLGVMQAEVGGQSVQRDQWIALAMVGLKRVQRHGREMSTQHKATEDPPQATAKATLATDDAAKLCQPATTGVVIIYYTT